MSGQRGGLGSWQKTLRGGCYQSVAPRDTVMELRQGSTINHQQISIRDYIRRTFRHRRCSIYIPTPSDPLTCGCGRHESEHQRVELNPPTKGHFPKWNTKDHTETVPPTSFGTISFHGFGQATQKYAPYLRVDESVRLGGESLSSVWELLRDKWRMPAPKMLVSVTGGAKSFFMKNRLKNNLKRGLINVATSSGAWIITGGTGTGVMQFVGEAVRDHQLTTGGTSRQQIVVLGIATWGILDNKEALTSKGEGRFPALYSIEHLDNQETTAPLDANHTHFLLVDDGTHHKYGKEIQFRAALESYISNQQTGISDSQGVHVPVVLLVLEGGVNTLETVYQALEKHTPVVIIQGSGRAADFISLAYREIHGSDEETKLTLDENVQLTRAASMFEWPEAEKAEGVEEVVATLKKILSPQNRPRITVFHMDDIDATKELDKAILFALLKAKRSNAEQQLSLALAWNRCDIAQQQIFDTKNRSNWQTLDLNKFMLTALLQDRADFVQLFMDNGVNLKKFLTKTTLQILYSKMQQEGKVLCFRHEHGQRPEPKTLYTVGKVINAFLGGQDKSLYKQDDHDEKDFDIPERELFFWAILLNRQQLSKLFWRAGKDHIGGALVASAMLQSLGKRAAENEELELSQDLFKSSEDWEKVAVGVLTECYQGDKERSHDLLIREVPTWGDCTLFTMADSGEHMDFMGHTCCQTKLNHIWKGRMALQTPPWKIILCMFLPIFLPLIRFTESKHHLWSREKKIESVHNNRSVWPAAEKEVEPQYDSTTDCGWMEEDEPDLDTVGPENTDTPGLFTLLSTFINYHKAPVTKFGFHILSHVVLTGLFSYFVLTDLAPVTPTRQPSHIEYVVWGWAATLFIEELRQVAAQDSKSFIFKVWRHFASVWNQFDLLMHLTLVISIILRYSLHGHDFVWARMLYSLVVVMYFLRLMNFFFAEKNVGPKVIMIRRMLRDLSFFIAILLTVLLAYGVAIQALLFPNSPPSLQLLKDVLYKPYWHIYGELFLEQLEGDVDNCSHDERVWGNATYGVARCPQKNIMVILMAAVYMMITNILLINLLIAMFSHTFTRIQENSEKVWCYYFYSLVYEYMDKPILAPPLIIISHLSRLVRYRLNTTRCCNTIHQTDFKKRLSSAENHVLTTFEQAGMENYLLKQRLREGEDKTSKGPNRKHTDEEAMLALQDRVAGLERQLCSQAQSMEKMVSMLTNIKGGINKTGM